MSRAVEKCGRSLWPTRNLNVNEILTFDRALALLELVAAALAIREW